MVTLKKVFSLCNIQNDEIIWIAEDQNSIFRTPMTGAEVRQKLDMKNTEVVRIKLCGLEGIDGYTFVIKKRPRNHKAKKERTSEVCKQNMNSISPMADEQLIQILYRDGYHAAAKRMEQLGSTGQEAESTKNPNSFIAALLECAPDDLRILETVRYDVKSIIRELKIASSWPRFIRIIGKVVDRGREDLDQAINDRICQLKEIPNERPMRDDEECELDALQSLDPFLDIDFCICGNTFDVCFSQKGYVYRMYLSSQLKEVEFKMGFTIKRGPSQQS